MREGVNFRAIVVDVGYGLLAQDVQKIYGSFKHAETRFNARSCIH